MERFTIINPHELIVSFITKRSFYIFILTLIFLLFIASPIDEQTATERYNEFYLLQLIVIVSISIFIGLFVRYRVVRSDQITAMKVANISGGSLFLLTWIYLLFSDLLFRDLVFLGCIPRYFALMAFLLMLGVISTTLFSYLYLDYFKRKPEQFVCSLLPGSLISLMCIVSGLIIILISIYGIQEIIAFIFHGVPSIPEPVRWVLRLWGILSAFGPLFFLLASLFVDLIGILTIILGINSAYILIKNKGSLPKGLEQWKVRGLQLSTFILVAGFVVAGVSSVSDPVGKTSIDYLLEIETREEVTILLPVPVDGSNQTIFNVDDFDVIRGAPDLNIVETKHGKALEVNTDTNTHIQARKECGLKGGEEIDKWHSTINISMVTTINRKHPTENYIFSINRIWIFSSKPDTNVKIGLFLKSECGEDQTYRNFGVNLKEGWQEISISKWHSRFSEQIYRQYSFF